MYVAVACETTRSSAADDMLEPSPTLAAPSAAASASDSPAPLDVLIITTDRALIVYST